MYRIKMTCYNSSCATYEDKPVNNGPFETKEEAYEIALGCAEDKLRLLNGENDGNPPNEGISFGIVEEENIGIITVNCYYLESRFDDTGNTKPITIYELEEIFPLVHSRRLALPPHVRGR